jgi:hypothetical protein
VVVELVPQLRVVCDLQAPASERVRTLEATAKRAVQLLHLYAGPSYTSSDRCMRQRVACSSSRQYLPKVLHIFCVGAHQ